MFRRLRFMSAGDSHGVGVLGIVDGLPAGISISKPAIEKDLHRRRHAGGRSGRMKKEGDTFRVYGGLRDGLTTGAPIGFVIDNVEWESWRDALDPFECDDDAMARRAIRLPRPGHADFAGAMKRDLEDARTVAERASARETVTRVFAGALARQLLSAIDVEILGVVTRVGSLQLPTPADTALHDFAALRKRTASNPWACLREDDVERIEATVDDARQAGDSLGGSVVVVSSPLPVGLGDYRQADLRLDARLCAALSSIPGVKCVGVGDTDQHQRLGSETHDAFEAGSFRRQSNRAGGIEGGMSNGERLRVFAHMKPIPSLPRPLVSRDLRTGEPGMAHRERADTCAVAALSVIAEAMVALVVVDALLEKFGGDSLEQLRRHLKASAAWL